jgi:phospholipid/cholesterol/gamma-HCH transport system substrate-binding protein
MDERSLELRVGLVVLATVAVLVVFVLLIGDIHFARQYKFYLDFKFSGAVAAGAPVKISGVKIGKVAAIEFIGDKPQSSAGEDAKPSERLQTRLTLAIDEANRGALPQGTEFFISTQGLLGEQYIEAVPGDRFGPAIEPGTTLRGVDPPRVDILLSRMSTILDAFSGLLSQNKGLLQDFAKAATGLTQNLDDVLVKKRAAIDSTVDNLAAISTHAKDMTEKLNLALGTAEELRATVRDLQTSAKQLPPAIESARHALSEGDRVLGAIDATQLKQTLGNAQTVSANAAALTDDAKVLVKKMRRGEGTVGALLSDEDIYDDLKELVRDLKQHPWKVIWRD